LAAIAFLKGGAVSPCPDAPKAGLRRRLGAGKPRSVRNIISGCAYTVVEALTVVGEPFYQRVVAFEIILTELIAWAALCWPRAANSPAAGPAAPAVDRLSHVAGFLGCAFV